MNFTLQSWLYESWPRHGHHLNPSEPDPRFVLLSPDAIYSEIGYLTVVTARCTRTYFGISAVLSRAEDPDTVMLGTNLFCFFFVLFRF
jgi:hypothetical protein